MTHTAISHVIGTVTLLMMFFSVGSYFMNYYHFIAEQTYSGQLRQIDDYLASNIIDLVTLAQTTPGDQFLVKQVKIPFSIAENLYDVSVAWMPLPSGDFNVARLTSSIGKLNQYVTVDLPYSNTSNIGIYSGGSIHGSYLMIDNSLSSDAAQSEAVVTGYATSTMVWCQKRGSTITIGFGVIQLN
jgi:hypothetical protein